MRTFLIIVDTLTYAETFLMEQLLALPHVWHSNYWGVAPYTHPAMASILTGMLPEAHGWFGKERGETPDTMASDWQSAAGVSGGGYADMPAWGLDRGFRSWRVQERDALIPVPEAVPDSDLVVIHTYVVHNYVFDSYGGSWDIHGYMTAEDKVAQPAILWRARLARIRKTESRILALIAAFPDCRIVVTADHGEGLSPGHCIGHGLHKKPSHELLHLPLVEFGVNLDRCDPTFVIQSDLRRWLKTGEESEPTRIMWPEFTFDLSPAGPRMA